MLRKSTEASVFLLTVHRQYHRFAVAAQMAAGRAQSSTLAASFDRVDRRRLTADVLPLMDETIFLVVLGAVSLLYAVGWFAISLPKGKRSEALSRIRRAIVALAAVPLRGR